MSSRDANGKFLKGVSGNKAGRPKGFAGLAAMIREETSDGRELVDFAVKVFRGNSYPVRERWLAHAWLSDRGFGKPIMAIDLQARVGQVAAQSPVDFALLNEEQMAAFGQLLDVASAPALALNAIDVESTEE